MSLLKTNTYNLLHTPPLLCHRHSLGKLCGFISGLFLYSRVVTTNIVIIIIERGSVIACLCVSLPTYIYLYLLAQRRKIKRQTCRTNEACNLSNIRKLKQTLRTNKNFLWSSLLSKVKWKDTTCDCSFVVLLSRLAHFI